MVKKKVKAAWFRSRANRDDRWGVVPVKWQGWVALFLLIAINVFSANYFNLNELILDNYLKMGVVFLLSIFVFVEIAKRRTV